MGIRPRLLVREGVPRRNSYQTVACAQPTASAMARNDKPWRFSI
ncbi:hypothetical protein HNR32_000189 [Pectinatus brassicae]|uniref:Uncharacterized protein n=1 Tax=Pectinatus brassicae TaxID=862415 RepID=A0A840UDK2_9FIRM|nr:hypothetical protein [Pectinatus brassicae]MBB5335089.1 hypothetical protein [Pectinatus brassicae]